ncbi:MAG: TraB/GumN family protein [Pikeienuella sp.]
MSRGWINLFGRAICASILLLGSAATATADCTDDDLLEQLAVEDPALHADIYREAATHPNHEGLLWRIEAPGVAPSFLFGTLHLSDHGTPELVATVKSKIANARMLMTEIGIADSERWAFEISNRMRKAKPSKFTG